MSKFKEYFILNRKFSTIFKNKRYSPYKPVLTNTPKKVLICIATF